MNQIEKIVVGKSIHVAMNFNADVTDGVIALTTADAISIVKLDEHPSEYGPVTTYESIWRGPVRHFAISCQTGMMALNQEYQNKQQIGAFNEEFADEPHIIITCTSNCVQSPKKFENILREAFMVSNTFEAWIIEIKERLLTLMQEDFALVVYFNGSWDSFRDYYLHFRPNGECFDIHYSNATICLISYNSTTFPENVFGCDETVGDLEIPVRGYPKPAKIRK